MVVHSINKLLILLCTCYPSDQRYNTHVIMSMYVINVGAHTIGFAQCFTFKQRLFNFNGTGKPDPSLNATLLLILQKLCPDNASNTHLAPLDRVTPTSFDNLYYKNLMRNFGLLQTDEALLHDNITASLVNKYTDFLTGLSNFYTDFDVSLEKMSRIGVLTGQQGEIRLNCRVINY